MMRVLMKHLGVPRRYHIPRDDGATLCGMKPPPERFWGVFEIPDELLRVLPGCTLCDRKAHDVRAVELEQAMTTIPHPSGDRHWRRAQPEKIKRGADAPGAKLSAA